VSFIGGVIAARKGQHIGVELLVKKIPGKNSERLYLFCQLPHLFLLHHHICSLLQDVANAFDAENFCPIAPNELSIPWFGNRMFSYGLHVPYGSN
jgi:hypothetical protein